MQLFEENCCKLYLFEKKGKDHHTDSRNKEHKKNLNI